MKLFTSENIKLALTIATVVASITVWGIRLEGKVNTVIALQERYSKTQDTITDSVMKLWKNVVALNTKVNLPTQ